MGPPQRSVHLLDQPHGWRLVSAFAAVNMERSTESAGPQNAPRTRQTVDRTSTTGQTHLRPADVLPTPICFTLLLGRTNRAVGRSLSRCSSGSTRRPLLTSLAARLAAIAAAASSPPVLSCGQQPCPSAACRLTRQCSGPGVCAGLQCFPRIRRRRCGRPAADCFFGQRRTSSWQFPMATAVQFPAGGSVGDLGVRAGRAKEVLKGIFQQPKGRVNGAELKTKNDGALRGGCKTRGRREVGFLVPLHPAAKPAVEGNGKGPGV